MRTDVCQHNSALFPVHNSALYFFLSHPARPVIFFLLSPLLPLLPFPPSFILRLPLPPFSRNTAKSRRWLRRHPGPRTTDAHRRRGRRKRMGQRRARSHWGRSHPVGIAPNPRQTAVNRTIPGGGALSFPSHVPRGTPSAARILRPFFLIALVNCEWGAGRCRRVPAVGVREVRRNDRGGAGRAVQGRSTAG